MIGDGVVRKADSAQRRGARPVVVLVIFVCGFVDGCEDANEILGLRLKKSK